MKRGMTLIETVVWISVATFAMIAVVTSLLSFYKANTYTIEQAQAVSDARRGIERTVSYLREAAFAADGAYPVVSISENEIQFYSDIDVDSFAEKIRLFLDGTAYKRGVVDPAGDPPNYNAPEDVSVVSNYVRNVEQGIAAFHYFDKNGGEILDGDVTKVRFVAVNLVVNVSPNRLPNELTLRSSATLRNLR